MSRLVFRENPMDRVPPGHPEQCQGTGKHGQCPNRQEYGSDYCRGCGGVSTKNQEEVRSYLLARVDHRRKLAKLEGPMDALSRLHGDVRQ